ncbi:hypothetical protein SH139x_004405 [Planctomycetaceae bacterium SH139]
MINRRRLAAAVGAIFWLGLIAGLVVLNSPASTPTASTPAAGLPASSSIPLAPSLSQQLLHFWTTPYQRIDLELPEVQARDGDPIFIQDDLGQWSQAGFLEWSDNRYSATRATAVWHTPLGSPDEFDLFYHHNRGKLNDVVRMLLPESKRKRLEMLIRDTIAQHGDEVTQLLRPIITKSLKDSMPVIEVAFRNSITARRDQLETLGDRYQTEVLEQRLLPLVREEVFPIFKQHGEPIAQQIGRELWRRASIWRFAWRGLYDQVPFTERELLREEWERYVEEEALPVLERYTPDLIEAQKLIFIDISKNKRIRAELRDVASDIAQDRELRELLTAILRDTFVDNPALRQVWVENWQSAEAKAALDLAGKRLEPLVRQIGDELFGTRDGGISPTFARVLRNQILGKDRRWLVAVRKNSEPGEPHNLPTHDNQSAGGERGSQTIAVRLATEAIAFPLIILADADADLLDSRVERSAAGGEN